MPSLRAAREQARLVICKARQSQNGLANIMYADGNNGKTLDCCGIDPRTGKFASGTAGDMVYIYAVNGWDVGLAKLFVSGILDHSRKSALIFYCPSVPKSNWRCADWYNPTLKPEDDAYKMPNIDRIMARNYTCAFVPVGTQVRNKWANGIPLSWGQDGAKRLENMPGQWGFDLTSDSRKAFIADPWPGYHNGKGVVWFLDGHIESWDSRVMMTRSWWQSCYDNVHNQENASYPYCDAREILWNYGSCFNWLDGLKGYTRPAE
jgi:prepilin-type processing-associated H-X9-DG protein